MNSRSILMASAAVALLLAATPVLAQTTSTTTTTRTTDTVVTPKNVAAPVVAPGATVTKQVETTKTPVVPSNTRVYRLEDFDVNTDGTLTRAEVGEILFRMYDSDGNGMIDNNEYHNNVILTVVPVEKTTTVRYDFDGDGVADKIEQSHDNFLHHTQLSRFGGAEKGLSAREFVDRGFLEADIDGDKFVSLKEFQGSYDASIDRSNKIQGNLNR